MYVQVINWRNVLEWKGSEEGRSGKEKEPNKDLTSAED